MRVDDQTKVTNVIAAAIEYIEQGSASSLAKLVRPALVSELRGAIATVSIAAKRELETLTTPDLERLTRHGLDTLRLRRWEEFQDAYRNGVEPFVVIARELAQPPLEQPRLPTGTHAAQCRHCNVALDSKTAPISDVAQLEPVARDFRGGNFYVRMVLLGAVTMTADERPQDHPERWAPLDLCQQCFEWVTSEAAQHFAMYGDGARRHTEDENT